MAVVDWSVSMASVGESRGGLGLPVVRPGSPAAAADWPMAVRLDGDWLPDATLNPDWRELAGAFVRLLVAMVMGDVVCVLPVSGEEGTAVAVVPGEGLDGDPGDDRLVGVVLPCDWSGLLPVSR